ncbi:hypothetical protein Tco_1319156 [Tanacetum coccineum]
MGRRWWVEGGEEWRLLAGYDGRRAAVGGDDEVTMVLKWVGGAVVMVMVAADGGGQWVNGVGCGRRRASWFGDE